MKYLKRFNEGEEFIPNSDGFENYPIDGLDYPGSLSGWEKSSDVDDEYDEENDHIDFGIRNDLHDVPGDVDLSIELEHKLRTEPDDSTLTVNDFLSQFGIEEVEMTGFAWAAILKNAQKYKDMPDSEFFKKYNDYKSKIVTEKLNESNKLHLSERILKRLIKSKDLYLIKYKVIDKTEKTKSDAYEYILVSQNKHEAKHDFKKLWEKGAKKIKSKVELDIISITVQTEFGKSVSKGSFKNKLMY